ncbi:MAG: hypothetical protein GF401_17860 [Chitinivibrionales bacterium]|nr:hypothetical protein [Chitinivibrionales bacterium]
MYNQREEREERLNRVRKASSFYSGNKHSSRRSLLRIVVIVTIVVLLTWYAKQGRNNPFIFEKKCILAGNSSVTWLALVRSPDYATILPLSVSSGAEGVQFPFDSISLVTLPSFSPSLSKVTPEPVQQITLGIDTIEPEGASDNSPTFATSRYTLDSGGKIRVVAGDNNVPGLLAELDKITFLICDSRFGVSDSIMLPVLKESIDILIISRAEDMEIRSLRNHFRPRKVIALPPGSYRKSSGEKSNIISPDSKHFYYQIQKNAMNKISIQKDQADFL